MLKQQVKRDIDAGMTWDELTDKHFLQFMDSRYGNNLEKYRAKKRAKLRWKEVCEDPLKIIEVDLNLIELAVTRAVKRMCPGA